MIGENVQHTRFNSQSKIADTSNDYVDFGTGGKMGNTGYGMASRGKKQLAASAYAPKKVKIQEKSQMNAMMNSTSPLPSNFAGHSRSILKQNVNVNFSGLAG